MAGTLTISTLSDGTNSTSSTNCIQGSAKAWVKAYFSSTPSISGYYNVSSLTRNSTGVYTVTFTNALADGNYSIVTSTQNFSSGGANFGPYAGGTWAAGSFQITSQSGGTVVDPNTYGCVAVFR